MASPDFCSRPEAPRRRPRRAMLAILLALAVLAWWAAMWLAAADSVLVRVPLLDESWYLRQAAAIQGGDRLPSGPAVMSPLYPYLVAATGSGREPDERGVLAGAPPLGIRLLQVAMWAGIVAILLLAGRGLLPPWAAPLPAVLFALYRPAAIYATTVLLEIPLTFFATAALHLLAGETGPPRPPAGPTAGPSAPPRRQEGAGIARSSLAAAALAGALLGLASLLRFHLVLLAPLGWWALGGWGRGRRRALVFAAAALLVVLPAVVRNSVLAGRPTGPSSNGGFNLYIGNGPHANGLFATLADFDLEEDPAGTAFLSRRLQRPIEGPGEADRIWTGLAWREVRDRPWRAVALWLRKAWLHFVAWEIPQVTPLGAWTAEAPPLRMLVVPYGLLAAGGLLGLSLVGWRDRRWRVWALAVAILVAAQSLFFVVSRYRLVLVPALCLLAAGGLVEAAALPPRRRPAAAALVAAVCLVVLPWGLGQERRQWQALSLANEAVRYEHLGGPPDLAHAEGLYRQAAEMDAGVPLVYRNLARTLVRRGDQAAAEAVLADGILRADPSWPLQRDLIGLLLARGEIESALPRLIAYLAERPDDAEMLHNQAVALARAGRLEESLQTARRLVERAPQDSQGYVDLGVLLARAGRHQEAERAFQAGLERHPGHTALAENLRRLREGAKVLEPSGVR